MRTYHISKSFSYQPALTEKVRAVMRMFGLDVQRLRQGCRRHECTLKLTAGDICYITGASGAGKSVLLGELYEQTPPDQRLWLGDIPIESDKSLVDCIEGDFFSALRVLSRAGLSDAFSVLNEPAMLSAGQKYRYRLARALAGDKRMIFADEFCSTLDRIAAAVISHNIRKIAGDTGKTFVLASSHDDLLCDLQPDVIVIKHFAGDDEIIYQKRSRFC
ncbi:MAG: ABC transporter [Planctomycetota bacterium]|nr:MAG: ABC transporter [Planctomycetota bacterium]